MLLVGEDRFREIAKIEPKQETLNHITYNIGDSIRIINPTKNQPKLFTTHRVNNDFGVVYYYQLDGKEESIGFSYIKKVEPKQETLGYICPQTKKQCDDECCVSAKDCHLEASMGVLSEPKQETLEEVKLRQLFKNRSNCYANADTVVQAMDENCFIETIKEWQAKRMYSEEEVLK